MNPIEKESPESVDLLLAQVCRLHYIRAHMLLEEIGLYRGQPPLLRLLAQQEGLTHSEVAAALHIAPATVTKMIQRLERAGFVRRWADAHDQRVSRLALTAAGQAVQTQMEATMAQIEAETFGDFSAQDRDQMRRLLLRARGNLMSVLGEHTTPEPA